MSTIFKVKPTAQACSIVNSNITIYETIFIYDIFYIWFSFNNEGVETGLWMVLAVRNLAGFILGSASLLAVWSSL